MVHIRLLRSHRRHLSTFVPWYQGLYLGVEICVKCAQSEGDSSLHVGICCKWLAIQVLKGPKDAEITGLHIANRTCDWLRRYGWKVTENLPYNPDLLLRDPRFSRR
jgi:hypothetical protein